MKKLFFKLKYPKLLVLVLTFILAYFIFRQWNSLPFHDEILSLGYFGIFLAGGFYAYGFTAAPATAVLLSLSKFQNLFLAGLIGGFGALMGDLIIFFFIRYQLNDEIKSLSKTKIAKFIDKEEKIIFGHFKKYALAAFSGFIIASPLPTEIGVTLMSSIRGLSVKKFAIIAYILHTIGILIILAIGRII